MRSDLRNSEGHKIRTGKLVAQGAHASMKVFFDKMIRPGKLVMHDTKAVDARILQLTKDELEWVDGKFTKICVSVDSEQELLDIHTKAKDAGLNCALIQDAGLTEFDGVPTYTCCAIGPNDSEEIDPITKDLKLL